MANEVITMFTSGSSSTHVTSSYHITQTATGSANSEFNLNTADTPVPTVGTIVAFKAWLEIPGLSATLQPEIGLAAGGVAGTIEEVAVIAAAAALINDVAAIPYVALNAFATPALNTSDLFIDTKPDDADPNSTIQIIIVIKHGAQ